MKNKLILGAAFLLAAITESLACTNLIVGKGASVDGSVIVSYSADSYGMFGELYHYPAGMHEKGTMRDIYDWFHLLSGDLLSVRHGTGHVYPVPAVLSLDIVARGGIPAHL